MDDDVDDIVTDTKRITLININSTGTSKVSLSFSILLEFSKLLNSDNIFI